MASYVVTCAGCGEDFEAKSPRAKWCGSGCKKRAQRKPKPAETKSETPPDPEPVDSGLVASVRSELAEAGVVDTFAGQLALELARKMSAVDATGVSGLSKELRQVMAEALADVGPTDEPDDGDEDDPVSAAEDEVARKRAERTAG